MAHRTFAVGDIHGDLSALVRVLSCFPNLDRDDTLVFLGDYLDRGPQSAQVIQYLRNLSKQTQARIVCLRGNHEDAWLRVVEAGWPEFVMPPVNGCLAALRSFSGGKVPHRAERPSRTELASMMSGSFIPRDVLAWMSDLPYFYEDEHAIYVHAGLTKGADGFVHPSKVAPPATLLWVRDEAFFREYRGKLVVFGHTTTACLPQELSSYTPDDPTDLWAGSAAVGLDTGCGKGGFLTALELPAMHVYESR